MYNQHLEIKPCKTGTGTGTGVFTLIDIPANVPIIEFTGNLIPKDKLTDDQAYWGLQVGAERFIGPSGAIDDYVNHSCDPNCSVHVVGNRAILYSLYVIPKGYQLTFDYSTTSTDTLDSWSMKCTCGSSKCRGTISGWQYLSAELKKEYETKGLFPMFITNPNLFIRKW